MPRMTGGDAIVDSLLRHGVDTVFGLPGAQMYGLFDSLARNANRIRVINARHEQTTAYMALGYAQSTGRPAVFTVVPGPGVLNTLAALATARGLNAPILCVTGEAPSAMIGRGRGALHEIPDQLATLRSLLKFAERIEHPTTAPQVMAHAFQAMISGRPGPVAVEIPWDQQPAQADVDLIEPLAPLANPTPDSARIAALAKLIDEAQAPMIWVGGGAMNAGAEVLALAEKIGAPVVANRTGKGVVDARHPLSLSTLGAQPLWRETDLLIGIGTRLSIPLPGWGPAAEGLKVARIDIDPAEPRRLAVDVPIVADAADAARALSAAVATKDGATRRSAISDAKAFAAEAIAKAQPQQGFIEAIREALPEDGVLVDEMTQVAYIAWNGYQTYQPRTFITSGFSGTLGYGFPTALGVKAANPDRAVVSIAGDGGFLYAGTELATAVHHGINLVTVVFDNASYGNVLRDQKRLYDGRHAGSLLTSPDFETYARAFGARSWRAEDPDELRSALPEALAADAPALIVVPSDIDKDYPPYALPSPRRR